MIFNICKFKIYQYILFDSILSLVLLYYMTYRLVILHIKILDSSLIIIFIK